MPHGRRQTLWTPVRAAARHGQSGPVSNASAGPPLVATVCAMPEVAGWSAAAAFKDGRESRILPARLLPPVVVLIGGLMTPCESRITRPRTRGVTPETSRLRWGHGFAAHAGQTTSDLGTRDSGPRRAGRRVRRLLRRMSVNRAHGGGAGTLVLLLVGST